MNEDIKIKNLIIVGGGSTGWIAAAYLTKALQGSVNITLIESDAIGTLGVGEGTVPSIKPEFFDFLEIPEEEWMPRCNATYKMGVKFVNWGYPSTKNDKDSFYHVFGESQELDGIPLTHYWLRKRFGGYEIPMSYACYPSPALCDAYKSPKYSDGRTAVNYSYHFDAGLVGEFLKSWATKRGVRRIVDRIVDVILDTSGNIESLTTEKCCNYKADLYLDCSGFGGILINKALKEPFISYSDSLLCDSAVTIRIPKNNKNEKLQGYTTATALSSGWVWEVPVWGRLGAGYVYSQNFKTAENAEKELRDFLGADAKNLPAKHLKMRVGRTQRAWVNNCISLGLSCGFIEPLEATGIYTIYSALHYLVKYFPDKSMNPGLRNKYNERIAYMFDDIRDFIVMHYCMTSREDTPFWKANKFDLVIPDSLQKLLEVYRSGAPVNMPYTSDSFYNQVFEAGFDRFWTNSNYLAILTGMNVLPDSALPILEHKKESLEKAEVGFELIKYSTEKLLNELPSHYEYIKGLHNKLELDANFSSNRLVLG
ncbi:MAG: tryptophan 7-halogenase [Richelia sp. RM2_1_2]|nr:tryptophan 7-halogenase [Richelia sp. SM1_7_0]NJN10545.1 tryptophan 7-halogenase [Richelia sp. RM1_1_1]NJO29425.1 tryptophan 7-halogenase [Richelia sp. SL_2_1]NJO65923.1 tryptophan 7-halogenase [Richelia sp. RM2_1_2]